MTAESTSRWTVTVTREADAALRAYIGALGMHTGDTSKFVEQAVCWRIFEQTVQTIKVQNVNRDADELQALIDEACEAERLHSGDGRHD